jgi:hypothetical protein
LYGCTQVNTDYQAERNKRGKFDVNLAETLKAMHSNITWRTPILCVADDSALGSKQPVHTMLQHDKNSFVYRLAKLQSETIKKIHRKKINSIKAPQISSWSKNIIFGGGGKGARYNGSENTSQKTNGLVFSFVSKKTERSSEQTEKVHLSSLRSSLSSFSPRPTGHPPPSHRNPSVPRPPADAPPSSSLQSSPLPKLNKFLTDTLKSHQSVFVELAEVLRATESDIILVQRLRLFQTLPSIHSALASVVAPAVLMAHIKHWLGTNRAAPYNNVPACYAAHVPAEFRSSH